MCESRFDQVIEAARRQIAMATVNSALLFPPPHPGASISKWETQSAMRRAGGVVGQWAMDGPRAVSAAMVGRSIRDPPPRQLGARTVST